MFHLSGCRGLLGGHSLAIMLKEKGEYMQWYSDELLQMAKQLGYKLLPAFNTTSGLPYPRVSNSEKCGSLCILLCGFEGINFCDPAIVAYLLEAGKKVASSSVTNLYEHFGEFAFEWCENLDSLNLFASLHEVMMQKEETNARLEFGPRIIRADYVVEAVE